MWKQEEESN